MKKFISILIFIFIFQSWTKADDISDYEIEGVSVGDRLFDHITLKQFNDWEDYKFYYKDKKFVVMPCNISSKQYDQVGCTFKNTSDRDYKIYGVNGTIKFPKDISKCLKKKDEVTKIFKDLLVNTEFIDRGTYEHDADPTGNSKQTAVDFEFRDSAYIRLVCHDWSDKLTKENGWIDEFKVYLTSKELNFFINNEAYE
tara:strand:- start:2711 stop:3304 length:594 start_codon:yes stop_codon:yes gene_type:complete